MSDTELQRQYIFEKEKTSSILARTCDEMMTSRDKKNICVERTPEEVDG